MSKTRATYYAFGLAVLGIVAYKSKMGTEEVSLWTGVLATGIPAAALALASVKAWPRKPRSKGDDV
jgi:hypothetical protein